MIRTRFFQKSRLGVLLSLLFLSCFSLGFSLSSSKSEGRSFPIPGNFEEVWNTTVEVLSDEKIPLNVTDKANGYLQTATFPLYKKEYKRWAKAPTFSSKGFCALEIGIVEKAPTFTIVGIRAFFKRKTGYHVTGFGKRDSSRGVFEGLLAKKIHQKLIETKYPKMKSVILGCDLFYDDKTASYIIAQADESTLAYEQGLRNGDVLWEIDKEKVTPANLFNFFLELDGEALKNMVVLRNKEKIPLPVSVFYLDPEVPHLGFRVERDLGTKRFRVSGVRADSPAARAGFLPGDILKMQNGVLLDSWKNYYRAILAQKEGEAQTFQIERGEALLEKIVTPLPEVGRA